MKRLRILFLYYVMFIVAFQGVGWVIDYYFGDGDGVFMPVIFLQAIITGFLVFFLELFISNRVVKFFLTVIASFMILAALTESVFYLIQIFSRETETPACFRSENLSRVLEPDDVVGFINKPNSTIRESLELGDGRLKSVSYSFDNCGRRNTFSASKGIKERFAVFFGGTNTFGLMVEDFQTIPSRFCYLDTTVIGYNYGNKGYGMHQMLAALESGRFEKQVHGKQGVLFYIYSVSQLKRAIGDQLSMNRWGERAPYYNLKRKGIEREGSFVTGRKSLTRFYQILDQSFLFRFTGLSLPGKLKKRHYRLGAAIIEKAAKEFYERYPGQIFMMVIYPGEDNTILSYLHKHNIFVLDLSKMKLAGCHSSCNDERIISSVADYQRIAEKLFDYLETFRSYEDKRSRKKDLIPVSGFFPFKN